jgi:chromosomal replication initiator protein
MFKIILENLEGALNKIIAFHQLKDIQPTIKSVKDVLSDFISNIQARSMSQRDIIDLVAKFYNINSKDLIGGGRKKELVWPRQIAIYLIREEIGSSYPSIGNELGGRDHTTAMHSYNKISHEVKDLKNEKIKQEIDSIKQLFNQPY